jgi:hypothetical protein
MKAILPKPFRVGRAYLGLAALLGMLAIPESPAQAAEYAIVITTAPQLPQDIWVSGRGNNDDGWRGGGVICLGVLAQGIPKGQHATIKVDIAEAGFVGIDGDPEDAAGDPIAGGTFVAPSEQFGDRVFDVIAGQTFFVILEGTVQNSTIPFFPKGARTRTMLTFDLDQFGRSIEDVVAWRDIGGGRFVPFLNEGPMMVSVRLFP